VRLRQMVNFYFNALGEYAMKLFTQLALVTAIASCGSAYAMQSMDDATLSDTTGQDGITVVIAPGTAALGILATTPGATTSAAGVALNGVTYVGGIAIGAAVLHDKDGISGTDSGGAIILGDAHQANTANAVGTEMGIYADGGITLNIDASGGGAAGTVSGTAPVLNVQVVLPSHLLIRTGDISVDGSNRGAIATGAAGDTAANLATGGTTGNAVKILNSMDIGMGGATLNIQLGNTPQGAMIKATGTITGGITIAGLSLHDASTSLGGFNGDLGVGHIYVHDATGANLTVGASIDVVSDVAGYLTNGVQTSAGGLVVTSTGPASNIMLQNVTLGSASSTLGDLELINVQSAGTHIAIMGH